MSPLAENKLVCMFMNNPGTIEAQTYHEAAVKNLRILYHNLKPWLKLGHNFVFQQDTDPKHVKKGKNGCEMDKAG